MRYKLITWETSSPLTLNISYHMKHNLFLFWATICWYHKMATTKIRWQIVICITIHQELVPPEPWTKHSTSTSKMLRWDLIHIMPIPVKKKDLYRIQITQMSRIRSINICSPTRHSSKFIHIKRKLSRIVMSPLSPPCQVCSYLFISNTKIKY